MIWVIWNNLNIVYIYLGINYYGIDNVVIDIELFRCGENLWFIILIKMEI